MKGGKKLTTLRNEGGDGLFILFVKREQKAAIILLDGTFDWQLLLVVSALFNIG